MLWMQLLGRRIFKTILEKFNVNQFTAHRDPISKIFSREIESKFSNFTCK